MKVLPLSEDQESACCILLKSWLRQPGLCFPGINKAERKKNLVILLVTMAVALPNAPAQNQYF